jgi:cell shape-determining protein MreC
LLLSSLTNLFDSKSLIGSLGIASAAILAGQPVVAGAAALMGSIIEVGKITVNVVLKDLDLANDSAEVALLVDIKNRGRSHE